MNKVLTKDPQLNQLLSGFDDPSSYQLNMQKGQKPNIKMTIKSNNAVSMSSNKAKTTRVTRCRGSLVKNKMGMLKPKIRCSSTKLNSKPREEGDRQSDLLKQIIGEVDREKQNYGMEVFNESENPANKTVMPLSKPSGCGCSQKPRTTCGLHTSMPNLNLNLNSNSNLNSKVDIIDRIKFLKMSHDWLLDIPGEFLTILLYCKNLVFTDKPNYKYIYNLLENLFTLLI